MNKSAATKRNNSKIHARKFLATPEGKAWLERKKAEEAELKLVSDVRKFIATIVQNLLWEYLITNIKKSIRNIIFSKFLSFVRPNTGRNQNCLFGSFLALLFYRSYFQHFSLASFS